ncbi:MAG TPA: ATP-binding protein [Armatimonadota bacterium]|nr:ATP-binding protein [Armatimonadota bacterium]
MVTTALRAGRMRAPRIPIPEFDPYRPVQITIPSGEQYVPEIRKFIERTSISTWLTTEDVAELKLAATEACLNAIRHGSPNGAASQVGVTVKPMIDQVVVEVCDEGQGFDVRQTRRRPFPAGENGRGVKLIDCLVDRAEYWHTGHGQVVRLIKRARMLYDTP